METTEILKNIGERTGGDIYLGIVGPVRVGKSTFIKKFMSRPSFRMSKTNTKKDG